MTVQPKRDTDHRQPARKTITLRSRKNKKVTVDARDARLLKLADDVVMKGRESE